MQGVSTNQAASRRFGLNTPAVEHDRFIQMVRQGWWPWQGNTQYVHAGVTTADAIARAFPENHPTEEWDAAARAAWQNRLVTFLNIARSGLNIAAATQQQSDDTIQAVFDEWRRVVAPTLPLGMVPPRLHHERLHNAAANRLETVAEAEAQWQLVCDVHFWDNFHLHGVSRPALEFVTRPDWARAWAAHLVSFPQCQPDQVSDACQEAQEEEEQPTITGTAYREEACVAHGLPGVHTISCANAGGYAAVWRQHMRDYPDCAANAQRGNFERAGYECADSQAAVNTPVAPIADSIAASSEHTYHL